MKSELLKKKIAILGFGLEGKAMFEYLVNNGVLPVVLDRMGKKEFSIKNPNLPAKTETRLGQTYLDNLNDFDLIFRSPGVPSLKEELVSAQKSGTIVTSQVEYFMSESAAPIIGVTGTKGKGTTSTLIAEILKKSGRKVFLGGNIGLPAISFLNQVQKDSWVVLELSSFQLQSLKKSPHIAVVLNITPDHLDYHKSFDEYRESKTNIVKFQSAEDFAVLNGDYNIPLEFAKMTPAKVSYFSRKTSVSGCYAKDGRIFLETAAGIIDIAGTGDVLLAGEHNLENITAGIEAAYLAGADIGSIRKAVSAFKGLEHRLELVAIKNKVKYINDSFSTTPETAIAAIRSFDEPKVLILGGSEKGADYKLLGRQIEKSNIKAVILIGVTAKNISEAIGPHFSGEKIFGLSKMTDIVEKAGKLAASGDVVILSPASASFGLFSDYKDRGNQFKKAVDKID